MPNSCFLNQTHITKQMILKFDISKRFMRISVSLSRPSNVLCERKHLRTRHKNNIYIIPKQKSHNHVASREIHVLSRKRNQSFTSKVSAFNEAPMVSIKWIPQLLGLVQTAFLTFERISRKSKSRYVRKYSTHRYDRDYVKNAARGKLFFSLSPPFSTNTP